MDDLLSRLRGGLSHSYHAFKEEAKPRFPFAIDSGRRELVVVLVAVFLEVEAEVEQRAREHFPLGGKEERHKESTDAAVAIEERVDCLEMRVCEGGLNEDGCRNGIVMEELLQGAHHRENFLVGRWNVAGSARPGASDPVLRSPKLSRRSLSSPHAGKEESVDFLDQAQAERETLLDTP